MNLTILGVVFAVTFFLFFALLAHISRKKLIELPVKQARSRQAPVAEFVDDLQRHRWMVIVGIALLVAVDKHFRIFGGLLQSWLVIAIVVTALFLARLLWRRRSQSESKGQANE